MPTLIELHRRLGRRTRAAFYRQHAEKELAYYRPYRDMERGVLPPDALAAVGSAGIGPYFIPDLRFIDSFGLADATIAHNPVTLPNSDRVLAHDRRPPPGYFAKRGVNFQIYGSATSRKEALTRAIYAVQVGPDLWLPFNAPNLAWVAVRFKQFAYNTEAVHRFEETLKNARLLIHGPFFVYLDGRRLFYVKDRCAAFEPAVFLHIVPRDKTDLPLDRRQYEFENRDFWMPLVGSLRVPRGDCVATRMLPDYPIAAIRTGQYFQGGERLWSREVRFVDGDWDGGQDTP